jgi:hypothetical protein
VPYKGHVISDAFIEALLDAVFSGLEPDCPQALVQSEQEIAKTLSCPLSTEKKSNVDSLGTSCDYRGNRLANRTGGVLDAG